MLVNLPLVFAVGGVFAVLALSEALWRAKVIKGEDARKLVHISVGTYVAFWPYFLSWRQIQLMSLAFLIVILISQQVILVLPKKLNIFHAIHGVRKRRWGEILFPVGIGVAAIMEPTPLIFTVAILHLSLADGLAAVVGVRHGMIHKYSIRNFTKTLAGSLTFWLVSTVLVAIAVILSPGGLTVATVPLVVLLPMLATLVENFGVNGIDNVLVPVLIIVVLQYAQTGRLL